MYYSDYIAQNDLNSYCKPALQATALRLESKWSKACKTLDHLESLPYDTSLDAAIQAGYSELESITAAQTELKYLETIEYNRSHSIKGIKATLNSYLNQECQYSRIKLGRKLAVETLLQELGKLA